MAKQGTVYHASPSRVDELLPMNLHGDPNEGAAIFATPDPTFAAAYLGRKWGDRDINQSGTSKGLTLEEMRPGAFEDIYGDTTGYMYELPGETFEKRKTLGNKFEVVSREPVKPTNVEEIKNVLRHLRGLPGLTLKSYDPKSRSRKAAIKRMLKRMSKMPTDDAEQYLKWMREVNPELAASLEKKGARRPYRERVEAFGLTPGGKLLSGIYSNDQSLGVFGGGVDPGEDILRAGAREMAEESGRKIRKLFEIPTSAFKQDWKPPYKTEKERERAERFRGSATRYIAGLLGGRIADRSEDIQSNLQDVRLRPLNEAIQTQLESIKQTSNAETKRRLRKRLRILQYLRKLVSEGKLATPAEKAAAEFAPGLPDPRRFGSPSQLPLNKLLSYVIQRHKAQRAGEHFDIRFGPDRGRKPTMMSWAARNLPTEPGEKRMLFQQPLHTGQYADFEGEIVQGYGKGTVKTHDRGRVIITKANPDQINFVVAHKKHPETYTLVRRSGPPATARTAREMKSQGGSWLMVNTTPTDVIKHKKLHYTKVPAQDVAKLFSEDYLHQEKIDGAAALYKVLSDRIEVLSYRPTTKGRPIVHTYRVGGTTGINIPKHLVGSILRGELYGVRTSTGRAVPPQELGGILNASTQRAIEKQRKQKVDLKSMIFNVLRYGKKDVPIETPLAERLNMLQEIQQHLPKGKFRLPEMARTPEEQKELWERVTSGKHPLTREGVVAWPIKGGKPSKVKLYSEHDVHVREIFPGEKRLAGTGAGGFRYSLTPSGEVVGKVGTGFSEATRKQMWESPDEFVGRIARIKAQEQFPSGAYRAPAFIGLHEDYPMKAAHPALLAAAELRKSAQQFTPEEYAAAQRMYAPSTVGGAVNTLGSMALMGGAFGGAGTLGRAGLHRLLPTRVNPVTIGKESVGVLKGLRHHVPAGAMGGMKAMYSPSVIMAMIEAIGNIFGAKADPEYQAGRIGYMQALKNRLGTQGRAAAIKRRQAFSGGPLGWLKGVAISPMQGSLSPIATLTDFLQTTFGKRSDEKVLGPIIKQALAEHGIEGDTLADLVKAASALPLKEAPSIMDRIRAFLLGMPTDEFTKTRENMRGASRAYETVKAFIDSLNLPDMPKPTGNI